MIRQMLRTAIVALGVVGATVAASLAVTGCGGESSRNASAATKPSTVPRTAILEKLPGPLGAGEQKLAPGVHVLDLVSRKQGPEGYARLPRIAITLPSGWFNFNGWAVNDGGTLAVAFWDVAKVYPTACRWQGKPLIDPGRTVDGLVRALTTRPLRHASTPRKVELAGSRGKYLRWSVPSKIDFSRCSRGYFESWTGRGWAGDRWQQGPGQVDRLWILDVNGKRLVIDANYLPSATRGQRAELDRIVHSIKFLPASNRLPRGGVNGAQGRPMIAAGCLQLGELKRAFPAAKAVGFTGRSRIKIQEAREPVFAGRCGAFWTTYTGLHGKTVDVGVTLYKTSRDVGAPLAEPLAGKGRVLPNGARVVTIRPTRVYVNGTPASEAFADSAFRRLFISSESISTAMSPVRKSVQLRIHRRIENGFVRLIATP
jgi:hypothetical protein